MAEKHGYEQVSIDEIRDELRELGVKEEDLKQGKIELITLLKRCQEDQRVQDVFDEVEEEPDEVVAQDNAAEVAPEVAKPVIPAYGSDNWQEFVIRQFKDDEMFDSGPNHDGCLRLVEELIGPVISSTIPQNTPPSKDNNGTATVVVRIEIDVRNETHPLFPGLICWEEIADVNKWNMEAPYCNHASNSAATVARSRALRLILGLRGIHTAEEMSETEEMGDPEWTVDEPITDSQITVINTMCQRMGINVMKFVNSGKRHYDKIEDVTKSTASNMIRELNNFQRQVKPTPDNILGYVEKWRK